jgi:hypothetical protein
MFLFLVLLVRMLYLIANKIVRVGILLHEGFADPTGECTGYKDCPCWWHTEQRSLAETKLK